MDTVLNVLHVLTAVFIVGPMAILPMTALRAIRAGNGSQVAVISKSIALFSYLSLIVVVLGFGLLGMADPKYHLSITTPWVLISLILYVIAFAVNFVVVLPALRKAAATGETASGSGGKSYSAVAAGSGIVSLLLVAVVVLMVWKP